MVLAASDVVGKDHTRLFQGITLGDLDKLQLIDIFLSMDWWSQEEKKEDERVSESLPERIRRALKNEKTFLTRMSADSDSCLWGSLSLQNQLKPLYIVTI